MATHISLDRQLALLWTHVRSVEERCFTVTEVAQALNLQRQTLVNLLHGQASNPRLETLRALSDFFCIPLDYFSLTSEGACLACLLRHQRLGASPALLCRIDLEARRLSPAATQNVLTILTWRQQAVKA